MTVHVFAGPTIGANRIRRLAPHAALHPPVKHGDLLRLALGPGDVALIIDGVWHQSAPVRHKEILALLADGVTVVGAASMGALRAAELAPYGMVGVGRIFEDFHAGRLDADDEVAVLHTPEGEQLSEALVNIRTALNRAVIDEKLSSYDALSLLDLARALPYTRRTWQALGRVAREADLDKPFTALNEWRSTHSYDAKREDAEEALALVAAGLPVPSGSEAWRDELWRTSFVRYWTATFRPTATGIELPFLSLLQHQQIYDPGFPARWRARVLSRITGLAATAPGAQMEAAAIKAAFADGVALAALAPEQKAFWLTPGEVQSLPQHEALLRIMVRSARLDGAWDAWPASRAEAGELLEAPVQTAEHVAVACQINTAVAADNPRHTTAHLDPERVARHLLVSWGLDHHAAPASRDAAARDRAFRDFAGAVEVDRAFYLGARVRTASPATIDIEPLI
ncbi:TfuA-like protein [Streptomyces vilmorinianum]|uniref:TfuA-like protein n=1 Tax=Streptomyces vilmorinianum TaxID=3051092 RepID=UPI0010FAE5B5|nr:TfuA-like protein [Streptomyces vilmorinianum]